jgi:hypothetical protein
MTTLLSLPPDFYIKKRSFGFFEDFEHFVTGDLFTDTSADSGAAVAMTDAAGGQITLTTGGTDNNECYLLTTKEIFLIAANKPLMFECRFNINEANTNDAAVALGFMSAVAADSIVDGGLTVQSSYSGAVFLKPKDTLTWTVETSIATTRTGTTSLTAANSLDGVAKVSTDAGWQTVRIEITPISATEAEAAFYHAGASGSLTLAKKITFTYTSATEMNAFVGVKAGGANSEIVTVDYITAYQLR